MPRESGETERKKEREREKERRGEMFLVAKSELQAATYCFELPGYTDKAPRGKLPNGRHGDVNNKQKAE